MVVAAAAAVVRKYGNTIKRNQISLVREIRCINVSLSDTCIYNSAWPRKLSDQIPNMIQTAYCFLYIG